MNWHPMFGYAEQGRDLTDAALYADALQPLGQAAPLPPFAFQSKAFADLEDEQVWTRNWVCVGPSASIPNPGDMLPHTIGQHGIHVQRQAGAALVGRFNFAQHGGCRFIPAQCQTGKKTKCYYTACGYSRDRDVMPAEADGSASAAMGQYLGPEPDRLMPIQVQECGPLVFANLDFEAQPVSRFIALHAATAHYFAQGVRRSARHKVEVQANWKTLGLHFLLACALPAHAERGSIDSGAARWSYSLRRETAVMDLVLERGWQSFCWVYPNLLMHFFEDHCVSVILQPTNLTSCLQYIDVFEVGQPSSGEHERDARVSHWLDAHRQDSAAIERLQTLLCAEESDERRAIAAHPLVWRFQQHFLAQMLARHAYFINKPLYSAPGRALNAGR